MSLHESNRYSVDFKHFSLELHCMKRTLGWLNKSTCTYISIGCSSIPTIPVVWVPTHKVYFSTLAYISGWLRQTVQTTCHRKFMVYFADKKYTTGFCFVSCYSSIGVDNSNKQIGFHGNALPSHKQRPLIKAALTLFHPTRCRIVKVGTVRMLFIRRIQN